MSALEQRRARAGARETSPADVQTIEQAFSFLVEEFSDSVERGWSGG
jgi:hypothetical protein